MFSRLFYRSTQRKDDAHHGHIVNQVLDGDNLFVALLKTLLLVDEVHHFRDQVEGIRNIFVIVVSFRSTVEQVLRKQSMSIDEVKKREREVSGEAML